MLFLERLLTTVKGHSALWKSTALRHRYAMTLAALEALREVRFAGCRKAATEIQELLRAHPQIGQGPSDPVSRACWNLLFELP